MHCCMKLLNVTVVEINIIIVDVCVCLTLAGYYLNVLCDYNSIQKT